MSHRLARRSWVERRFELGLPAVAFPDVVERVRGTPARLEERLAGLDPERLVARSEGAWSILENAGHLLDLEPLWDRRLDELLGGSEALEPADMTNRCTEEAGHNERDPESLLQAFRSARGAIVSRLDGLTSADLERSALHPRLRQPMTITDLTFFVAEHDDHHLARISEILQQAATQGGER